MIRSPSRLAEQFGALFEAEPTALWRAPGRVNLIGEHTDYNEGYVLPLALQLEAHAAVAPRTDGRLRMSSLQAGGDVVDVLLDDLEPGSVSGWWAYVAGSVWALRDAGIAIGGADVLVDSDVPVGAGLSSSAALECAVLGALVSTMPADELSAEALALTAVKVENDYVGMPCGVMDQFAATISRAETLLLLDTRTFRYRHVPLDLPRAGLSLLVIDTRAPHRLVDGEYAARRRDCEQAARLLGLEALRDVIDPTAALESLPTEHLRRRVRHVLTENERVLQLVELLDAGQMREIGPLLTSSHASLRDDYEVSCPELDVAVEACLMAGAYGARMTGGGFGGSAIALVDSRSVTATTATVGRAFSSAGFADPVIYVAQLSDGAGPLV